MQAKELLFFDLDGTIIDPLVGITQSVAYALRSMGLSVEDPTSLTHFIGPPLTWSFREYYGFDEEKVQQAVALYREKFSQHGLHANTLYPGMQTLLKNFYPSKTLVIATSKPAVFALEIVKRWDIAGYFAHICGSELTGERSDKAEVIAYAMEQCGCSDPEKIIMIGDRKHDIIGAKRNGMQSIGVLYGYGDQQELNEAGADYIAESVADLSALLAR